MFEEYGDVLTPEEVGEILQIGNNLLYKMLRSGEIPSRRFGRVYRISKEELINYLNHKK